MQIAIHDHNVRPTLGVNMLKAEAKLFIEGMKAAGFKGPCPTDALNVARVCAVIEAAVPGLAGKLAERVVAEREVLCVLVSETFDGRLLRFRQTAEARAEPAPPSQPAGAQPPQGHAEVDGARAMLAQGVRVADLPAKVRVVFDRMLAKAEWAEAEPPPEPVLAQLRAEGVAIPTHAAQISVGPAGALRCLKLSDGGVVVNREDLEGFTRVFVRT